MARPSDELVPVWHAWPDARIRQRIDANRGIVTEFVMQLEYDVNARLDGSGGRDWRQVARFDHELGGEHDWRQEGPHMDLYREVDGEMTKCGVVRDFPRVPLREAAEFSKQYLVDNADGILGRFETWHGIQGRWNSTTPRRRDR